jgi:hypothetical protein
MRHATLRTFVVIAILGACSPAATLAPSPTTASTPTAPPVAAPSASFGGLSQAYTSQQYGFSWTLPSAFLEGSWRPASTTWNGTEPTDMNAPFADAIKTISGTVFVIGTASTQSDDAFADTVRTNLTTSQSCAKPILRVKPPLAGGVSVAQSFQCKTGLVVAVSTVRNGKGLVIVMDVNPGDSNGPALLVSWLTDLSLASP